MGFVTYFCFRSCQNIELRSVKYFTFGRNILTNCLPLVARRDLISEKCWAWSLGVKLPAYFPASATICGVCCLWLVPCFAGPWGIQRSLWHRSSLRGVLFKYTVVQLRVFMWYWKKGYSLLPVILGIATNICLRLSGLVFHVTMKHVTKQTQAKSFFTVRVTCFFY